MPKTRLDVGEEFHIRVHNGVVTKVNVEWIDELSDGTHSWTDSRNGDLVFADLPPGAKTSFGSFLGHIRTLRDNTHPLEPVEP